MEESNRIAVSEAGECKASAEWAWALSAENIGAGVSKQEHGDVPRPVNVQDYQQVPMYLRWSHAVRQRRKGMLRCSPRGLFGAKSVILGHVKDVWWGMADLPAPSATKPTEGSRASGVGKAWERWRSRVATCRQWRRVGQLLM